MNHLGEAKNSLQAGFTLSEWISNVMELFLALKFAISGHAAHPG